MKRAAIVVFSLCLLGFVTVRLASGQEPSTVVVNTDSAMLRAAPESDATGLLMVYRGDKLDVVEAKPGWFKVKFTAQDYELWVSSDYLKRENGHARCTGDRVAVRAGGGLNYDVLGRIDYGYQVKVLTERDGWTRIAPVEGATAWVSATEAVAEAAIRPVAPTTDLGAPSPGETDEAETLKDLYDKTLAEFLAEQAKPAGGRDFSSAREAFEKVRAEADSVVLRSKAMRRLEEIAFLEAIEERQRALEEGRKRLAALLAAVGRGEWSAVTGKSVQEPQPIEPELPSAHGRLEKLGIRISGFKYKLVDPTSENILYLVRSSTVDLDAFEGEVVKVEGRIVAVSTYPLNGIEVVELKAK